MPSITLAYINLFGQTGLKADKILALSDFIKLNKVDIVNC